MTQYMTIPEVAVLWQTNPESVRQACEAHCISGAVRFGRSWWIPEGVQQPEAIRTLITGTSTIQFAGESHYQSRLKANRGEL